VSVGPWGGPLGAALAVRASRLPAADTQSPQAVVPAKGDAGEGGAGEGGAREDGVGEAGAGEDGADNGGDGDADERDADESGGVERDGRASHRPASAARHGVSEAGAARRQRSAG
jgi:hypothetical protein